MGSLTPAEYQKQLSWAERMETDVEYTKVWIATIKQLFDVEDQNNDKTLQKEEFAKFMSTVQLIMLSPERAAKQNSPEIIDRAWNAMKNFTMGEDDVSWNDFMRMQ